MSILVRKLNNGVYLPPVALGCWRLNDESAASVVPAALKHGYRAVDDAWVYENEAAVGKAVREFDGKVTGPEKTPIATSKTVVVSEKEFLDNFSVPHGKPSDNRKVFVTSKIWVRHFDRETIREKTEEHLKNFGRSSCDLMLLHWPGIHPGFGTKEDQDKFNSDACRFASWKALEELYHEGKVRAIGVSNYMPKHLKALLKDIATRKAAGCKKAMVPMTNQIEINPYHLPSAELQQLCEDNDIVLCSYSTLGGKDGVAELMSNPVLQEMAKKHKKTIPQVIVRWAVQMGYQTLPKSSSAERAVSNFDVMDFELSVEDMKGISELNQNRCFLLDPELID